MISLKIQRLGSSVGVILPNEMLARLKATAGQEILAVETPSGYLLTSLDPHVRKQVEAGEKLMEKYRDVFARLAK